MAGEPLCRGFSRPHRRRERVRRLTAEIIEAEREIDSIVYNLFDLTPDEIELLETSLKGQY